jgi:hypothetical protein
MSGIGVVLNPRSRQNLRDPGAVLRLARQLGDHGIVRAVGSIDELYRTAEDFKGLGIEVLGISGGDGTNHVTITGFLNVYDGMALPHLAFLRGGTMNTVANAVGVRRGRPEGLLGRLIRAYAARASLPLENVERHVMRIAPLERAGSHANGSSVTKTPTGAHYGFLFGTGVVRGFLAEYYRDGEPSPLVAAKTLLRGVGSAAIRGGTIRRMAAPFRGSVTVEASDGEVLAQWPVRSYLAVAAGTIDQIGLNFRPFYRFAETPGTFHMLGIHASPLGFVAELPRVWRAEPMREGKAFEATPARAVVRGEHGFVQYMIDGDLHEARGDVVVDVGPRVKILVVP